MVKDIDQFINNLTAEFNSKQRKVVFERFGLKTGVKATLQEIGNDLGVTRERVRQIEEDGLRKLGPKVKKEAVQIVEFAHTYLANAGGVTVSYFEWAQNNAGYYWAKADVFAKLKRIMDESFQAVWQIMAEKKVNPRLAAYILAVDRVVKAMQLRGR